MSIKKHIKPIIVTVGEPAGIGPDCIIRACQAQPEAFDNVVVAAPASWLQQRAELIKADISIQSHPSLHQAADAVQAATQQCAEKNTSSPPRQAIHCWNPVLAHTYSDVTAAKPSAHTASAVVHCIEAAALACLKGEAAGLVTGPIEKAILRSSGFQFPGHTEFLAHLAAQASPQSPERTDAVRPAERGSAENFVMMLASEQIRVALLTTHLALRHVPDALSTAATLQCLRITDHDLRKHFGIRTPRLALCGLNPHAGEQGHFGREEIDVLAPAVQQAQDEGLQVSGPLPADTIFSAPVRQHYDAIVCCYHDQALIPLKALSFGEAVNVTLGLPFIRTSVDHGTALDRVGGNDVSCTSLLAAIDMAQEMSRAGSREQAEV